MSSPFEIHQTKNHYVVTWPSFRNIQGNLWCYNLFKILFEQIKVDSATILINNQHLSVGSHIWYDKIHRGAWCHWIGSTHEITGALFNEEKQAILLQEELEKRYMWNLLKA